MTSSTTTRPRQALEFEGTSDPARAFPLTSSTGALVIGGDYRGLGVVRSLGRRGIPVWVLTDEHRLAARSRYARRSFPWPEGNADEKVTFLIDLARQFDLNGWLLIPTGDETSAFVSRRHEMLSQVFTLTTAPWEVFRWAYDKRLMNELADRCGITRPKTWHPKSVEDLKALEVTFPVILKPAFKTTMNAFTITKAWRVESRDELIRRYEEALDHAEPGAVMVQEIVVGGGETQLSYAVLAEEGRVKASITARRTRQYPMDFGRASTFVETITDLEVEVAARKLIQSMDYTGLVEVEFKRDSRDGQLKLLDINPRVWGWHSIGPRAGTDFSYLLWRQCFGLEVEDVRAALGVRWVRGLTDLPTVAKEIRSRRLGVFSYLRSLRPPMEWAIMAADDPFPAIAEVPETIQIAMRRGELKQDLAPTNN